MRREFLDARQRADGRGLAREFLIDVKKHHGEKSFAEIPAGAGRAAAMTSAIADAAAA
jgi:hypothetical protein